MAGGRNNDVLYGGNGRRPAHRRLTTSTASTAAGGATTGIRPGAGTRAGKLVDCEPGYDWVDPRPGRSRQRATGERVTLPRHPLAFAHERDRGDLLRGPVRALGARQLEATELDFTEDARQWREDFTEFERQAALWNYCLFFRGEDAVADNLSPVHRRGAAGGAEVLPRRPSRSTRRATRSSSSASCRRSCGVGDGSMASGLARSSRS